MASWSSQAALNLLIISYLAHFLQAKVQYNATADGPRQWINNNLSIPSAFGSVRIILLNKKPNDVTTQNSTSSIDFTVGFACGFYTYYGKNNPTYFGIGFAKLSEDKNGTEKIVSFGNLIWVANRNKPVGGNATLGLFEDGDLILRDADNNLIWSTGTSNMSAVGMKLLETGNFVLYDKNNKTVWQSFDHPVDVLLPGQILQAGKKLVASVSKTNWSEGSFYLSVTSLGFFAFYHDDVSQMYFNFSVPQMVESIELNYNTSDSLALYILPVASSGEQYPVSTSTLDRANMSYMKFDIDGHLRIYDDSTFESVDLLADVLGECDYPTTCGNYGLCSNAGCSCPPGFAVNNVTDAQGKKGCLEMNPVSCEDLHMQTLEDVYHFSYVDPDAAFLKGIDIDGCKEACLKNCSCSAALFQFLHNFSTGNCFLPSPVLSLIRDGKERNHYQSYAFIKVSKQTLSKRGSLTSTARVEIIAGATIGAFLLVGGLLWVLLFRKKGDVESAEKELDDYLDQLPEMPKRFTYRELKIATCNFQKKLGGGGFGSVFEGILPNGEKIAVKRLDVLGQGEKVFMAEVKTIGSIHHVNLVKLIGFCAEKLQRLLVYEFMCNKSLDKWIFPCQPQYSLLSWQARKTIILDIAKGLAYLHEDCRQRIIHLDIKPQNILLDSNLSAKISDFGLCKLIDKDQSQVVTTMRGTPGYLAPEWFSSVITEKADVYSFGIVVMEVVCGRENLDGSQLEEFMHLLPICMKKAEDRQLADIVDRSNEDMQLHKSEAVEIMRLAIWCVQSDFTRRPSMSMVVKALEGTMDVEEDLDYSIPPSQ